MLGTEGYRFRNPHTELAGQGSLGRRENMSKVWFITGAGRGMGVDIAKAAVAAGHKVVATGRNTDRVAAALGDPPNCS